jgi:hypothetical protein
VRLDYAATPQTENSPRLETGGAPTTKKSSPRTRVTTEKEDPPLTTIRQVNDIRIRSQRTARRGRRPIAHASQAAPCAGRTQWHLMYQCGACGGTHFGRSPVELKTGKRLARCGRVVWLVIARTYRPRRNRAGAA